MDQDSMLVESRLDTLSQGRFLERANEKLLEAISHCLEYPDLGKAREVVLTLSLKPDADEETVRVGVKTDLKLRLPSSAGPSDVVFVRDGRMSVMNQVYGEEAQTDIADFMAARVGRGE